MNTDTIKRIFQSQFDYTTYCNEIVHNIFGCNDIATSPEQLPSSSDGDQNYFIGRMADAERRDLGFFYTRVAEGSDVRRKRVGLRKLIQPYLKYEVDAAIAVFDDGNHWRLSYICDMKEGVTAAKRFSYILGDPQGQYKTPLERLGKIASRSGRFVLDDLKEAFSVDALSKEFFDEYHRHYDIIVKELDRQGNSGALYHDYVKKMLGRIVFLHFLQKKGWLDGNQAFLRDLFFMQPLDRRADFLEKVLEPLFFGIFNTEIAQRERQFSDRHWDKQLLEDWSALPYLNGGLFEEDAVDKLHIKLPGSLFEDLFTFLASYNFTVDENDPDDAEVGVDPEMLGKIFESLLEDNKAKGAFYTPKEIVRYMCKESLIAYLVSQIDKSQSEAGPASLPSEQKENSDNSFHSDCNKANSDCDKQVRSFVEHHEFQSELEPYRDILDAALRNVKICDPAIGSGAFPMGLLNELWRCREAIEETASRVDLKKEIIENNIYGVDIERGAIDIARLRFWLSIVVDAEEPEPLPNFDYKFMQGNSLIESYKGIDLSRISNRLRGGQSKSTQLLLGLDSDFSKKNLQRLMRDYFSVTDHKQKASMRQAINDEVKRLITDFIGGTAADLDKLDPSANQDFFLWHTWFKDIFDNGGFDIVIANPPYLDYREIDEKIIAQTKHWKLNFNSSRPNLYVYFVEFGEKILNANGLLTLINPVAMLSTDYSYGIRKYLLNNGSIRWIRDISHIKVFAEASTYVMMWNYQRGLNSRDIDVKQCNDYSDLNNAFTNTIAYKDVLESHSLIIPCSSNVDLVKKIETGKTELAKCAVLKWGTSATGYGKMKIMHGDYLALPNSEKKRYKPIIQTADIKKYHIRWQQEYIPIDIFSNSIIQEFNKRKIVIGRLTKEIQACIDTDQYYVGKSTIVTDISKSYSDLFILALLNSKLINYWFTSKFETTHMAGGYIRFDIPYLKQMPIPKATAEEQHDIAEIVNKILSEKRTNITVDTSVLEQQIDRLVYQLYNLTPEEIAIIEQ